MAGPNHTEDEVQQALAEKAGAIFRECIMGAWGDYRKKYKPGLRLIHSGRTRASIIYDHTAERLGARLAEIPGALIVKIRGLSVVLLNDNFVIKVPKKLNKHKLSRTYLTNQTLGFLHQNQSAFPFLSHRTSLVIGYVLDAIASSISEVFVACPNGPKHNWFAFPLLAPAVADSIQPAATASPETLPFTVEVADAEQVVE